MHRHTHEILSDTAMSHCRRFLNALAFRGHTNNQIRSYLCHSPVCIKSHVNRQSRYYCSNSNKEDDQTVVSKPDVIDIHAMVEREMAKYDIEDLTGDSGDVFRPSPMRKEKNIPISLQHGVSGVFDLEDLLTLIRAENVFDICVLKVPKYKLRRRASEPASLIIEGKRTSENWAAIDFGNLALHLFLEPVRRQYDVEALWALGPEHDPHLQRAAPEVDSSHFGEAFLAVLRERNLLPGQQHDVTPQPDTAEETGSAYVVTEKQRRRMWRENQPTNQHGRVIRRP